MPIGISASLGNSYKVNSLLSISNFTTCFWKYYSCEPYRIVILAAHCNRTHCFELDVLYLIFCYALSAVIPSAKSGYLSLLAFSQRPLRTRPCTWNQGRFALSRHWWSELCTFQIAFPVQSSAKLHYCFDRQTTSFLSCQIPSPNHGSKFASRLPIWYLDEIFKAFRRRVKEEQVPCSYGS